MSMGMTVKLNPRFLGLVADRLQKATRPMLSDIASKMQADVRIGLLNKKIKDTGHLIGSYKRKVTVSGGRGLAVVGSNSIYALPMELGITKRFFPPAEMVANIMRWVKRKNIAGTRRKYGEKALGDEYRTAMAIAISIGRKGLDASRFPSHVVRDAVQNGASAIATIIHRHIKRALGLVGRVVE